MYSFNQPITPTAKSHLDAQMSFFNDMSKSLFRSAQKISELNMNLAQTLMQESAQASQEILSAKLPVEMLAATASKAHPVTEKVRAYHQYLTRIAADAQVDLSKCAEEHVQETSRTAKALADEITKATNEEIEHVKQRQMDAVRKASDQINEWQTDGHSQQDGNAGSTQAHNGGSESLRPGMSQAPASAGKQSSTAIKNV